MLHKRYPWCLTSVEGRWDSLPTGDEERMFTDYEVGQRKDRNKEKPIEQKWGRNSPVLTVKNSHTHHGKKH